MLIAVAVVLTMYWWVSRLDEELPLSWQIALGKETAQPAEPTVFGDGTYRFMRMQPFDPSRPMGFNPCKRIALRVNLRGAPSDAMDLVYTSMEHIHRASGLSFAYAGQTPDRPTAVGRVGPVLVSWATRQEIPSMNGVYGRGGSGSYPGQPGETTYYVSGVVTLSAEEFADMPRWRQQAVMDHEFEHLAGLNHVQDKGELMFEYENGRTTFGHGDLTGLALLGRIPCR